jgi:hypothetical protein
MILHFNTTPILRQEKQEINISGALINNQIILI